MNSLINDISFGNGCFDSTRLLVAFSIAARERYDVIPRVIRFVPSEDDPCCGQFFISLGRVILELEQGSGAYFINILNKGVRYEGGGIFSADQLHDELEEFFSGIERAVLFDESSENDYADKLIDECIKKERKQNVR